MSYFFRVCSGSFINRMNMVGTMKMVSIRSTSISRRNSSGSNRGISTSAPPRRPERRPNEFGAEWYSGPGSSARTPGFMP
jgi:hypothetical protein